MLVGREDELGSIRQVLAAARLGRSGGLLLTGEAGIGKSALLEAATTMARSSDAMSVLAATGRPAESRVPFGGLLELLRPALPVLPTIPAPQREALEVALALRSGDDPGRFAVGHAVLSVLCRYAERAPVLLVVDDLMWLDSASSHAIGFATSRLADDPVAVLAATRRAPPSELALPQHRVTGLDRDEAEELLAGVAEDLPAEELHGEDRERVLATAAGNPLGLRELVRSAAGHRMRYPGEPLPLPTDLVDAFAGRVAATDDTSREVLLVAAMAGEVVRRVAAACRSLGLSDEAVADSLCTLTDDGLLVVSGDRVEFAHPMIRAAVYGAADAATRRRTHRAVAEGLDHGTDQRAWHLAEASVLPDEEMARALEQCAERASARSAHSIAALAWERAAELTPAVAGAADRLLAGAGAAWQAGDVADAIRLLDLTEASGRASTVPCLALRGTVLSHTGQPGGSALLCEAARGAGAPDEAVAYLTDAVVDCFYVADGHRAGEIVDMLERLLPRTTTDAAAALGSLALGMGRVLCGRGGTEDVRAVLDRLDRGPDLVPEVMHGPPVVAGAHRASWLLLAPLWLREDTQPRLPAAIDELRDGAALGVLPCLLFQVARNEATSDQWGRSEATYRESIRLADVSGQRRDEVMSIAGLCWLQARRGRPADVRELRDRAHALDPTGHLRHAEMWLRFASGEQALADGRAEEAAGELEQLTAMQASSAFGDVDMDPTPERVEALCHLGRHREAGEVALRYAERAAAKGQPWARARAARGLALTASRDRAEAGFVEALSLHAATPDGFEAARTRLAYGGWLRRGRRRRDARVQLRQAVATLDDLGARPWAEVAATELDATGETAQRREVGAPGRLTPQELQVATLLSEGRTTREAAAALFLSPKTVEYHLRKAYLKLDVHSRDALAAVLAGGDDAAGR